MSIRPLKVLAATLASSCLLAAVAQAAGPPPPPTSPAGKKVTEVAVGGGMFTPTAFAFGDGQLFEADGGLETAKVPNGGVFVIKNGAGVKIPSPLLFVSGLAWHQGSLYVAGVSATSPTNIFSSIQKWSGWNGTAFSSQKAIYTAPKKFQGFNGIAFGPNGRLYAGTDVGLLNNNDHGPAKTPYVYSILSMKANGKGLKVFATGIRQPWQLAFAPGSKDPLVSALGQDSGANEKKVPDFVLKVHQGDNYGFPTCNHIVAAKCKGFAKPFRTFKPHTDIMGMAIIGKTLYMTSFLGTTGKAGEVFSMPLSGGKLTPVLKGFVAPTVGLGTDGKTLYVGEVGGKVGKVLEPAQIFSVTP